MSLRSRRREDPVRNGNVMSATATNRGMAGNATSSQQRPSRPTQRWRSRFRDRSVSTSLSSMSAWSSSSPRSSSGSNSVGTANSPPSTHQDVGEDSHVEESSAVAPIAPPSTTLMAPMATVGATISPPSTPQMVSVSSLVKPGLRNGGRVRDTMGMSQGPGRDRGTAVRALHPHQLSTTTSATGTVGSSRSMPPQQAGPTAGGVTGRGEGGGATNTAGAVAGVVGSDVSSEGGGSRPSSMRLRRSLSFTTSLSQFADTAARVAAAVTPGRSRGHKEILEKGESAATSGGPKYSEGDTPQAETKLQGPVGGEGGGGGEDEHVGQGMSSRSMLPLERAMGVLNGQSAGERGKGDHSQKGEGNMDKSQVRRRRNRDSSSRGGGEVQGVLDGDVSTSPGGFKTSVRGALKKTSSSSSNPAKKSSKDSKALGTGKPMVTSMAGQHGGAESTASSLGTRDRSGSAISGRSKIPTADQSSRSLVRKGSSAGALLPASVLGHMPIVTKVETPPTQQSLESDCSNGNGGKIRGNGGGDNNRSAVSPSKTAASTGGLPARARSFRHRFPIRTRQQSISSSPLTQIDQRTPTKMGATKPVVMTGEAGKDPAVQTDSGASVCIRRSFSAEVKSYNGNSEATATGNNHRLHNRVQDGSGGGSGSAIKREHGKSWSSRGPSGYSNVDKVVVKGSLKGSGSGNGSGSGSRWPSISGPPGKPGVRNGDEVEVGVGVNQTSAGGALSGTNVSKVSSRVRRAGGKRAPPVHLSPRQLQGNDLSSVSDKGEATVLPSKSKDRSLAAVGVTPGSISTEEQKSGTLVQGSNVKRTANIGRTRASQARADGLQQASPSGMLPPRNQQDCSLSSLPQSSLERNFSSPTARSSASFTPSVQGKKEDKQRSTLLSGVKGTPTPSTAAPPRGSPRDVKMTNKARSATGVGELSKTTESGSEHKEAGDK
ncbi:unnamed protein product, partial [Choristocarpus tenellus]